MEFPKIISVDDHIIEPPNLWLDRLPKKFLDDGPRVERKKAKFSFGGTYDLSLDEEGQWGDMWFYEGRLTYAHRRNTTIPKTAVSREPGGAEINMAEMELTPITYDEMIPGCYDPVHRVSDMELNWVDGSLCFPTFPRFCGQTFYEGNDKELGLACVQVYNDYMVEEWCGPSEGRLIPLCLIPLWDVELAAAEIRRNAERGVHGVAFSEIPPHLGLPSIHSGYWDPFFAACEETSTTVNMHIGSSSKMPTTSADSGPCVAGTLSWVNSMSSLADYLFSGVFVRFPGLKVAFSEGGIGWIPHALEKADDTWESHSNWTHIKERMPEPPSTYYFSNVYACTIRDPFGIENLDRIGVNNVTFETDYPHTDTTWPNTREYAEKELAGLSEATLYRILRGNAIEMLSLAIT